MAWMRVASLAGMMALGTWAHAQDWTEVEHLKRGTVVLVETQPPRWGPALEERCQVEVVDGQSLTCERSGTTGTRLVFPAKEVTAVYRIRHKRPLVPASLAPALLVVAGGLVVIGVLGSLPPLAAAGGAVLLVAIVAAFVRGASDLGHAIAGVPPAGPGDKLVLVYYRAFQP